MSPEQEALAAVSAAMARERKLLSDALENVKRERTRYREALQECEDIIDAILAHTPANFSIPAPSRMVYLRATFARAQRRERLTPSSAIAAQEASVS